jgi:anti-anti-sigma regulatory factor
MAEDAYEQLLEVAQIEQTTVVRFRRRTVLEPSSIRAIGSKLSRLVNEDGRRTILVNFQGVESLTSAMIGELATLHRGLIACGGRLAFCGVEPFLMQVFKVVKIPERIAIYGDETAALQTLSSAEPQNENMSGKTQ